jgi:hypothetical protein
MDERGLAILRQLMSDVEGAPSPGVMKDELYSIWYEHAQSVAQEALEYLNTSYPDHSPDADESIDFE